MATCVIPLSNNQPLNSFKELVTVPNSRVCFFNPSPSMVATTTFLCTSSPHPRDTTCLKLTCGVSIVIVFIMWHMPELNYESSIKMVTPASHQIFILVGVKKLSCWFHMIKIVYFQRYHMELA